MQFKFVSGPHLGAELSLDPGTYLLGTDAQCDLILNENLEVPCAVKLELSADGTLSAALAEGSARLNGQELTEKPQPWTAGTVLVIGLSALVPYSGSFDLTAVDLSSLGLLTAAPPAADSESTVTDSPAAQPDSTEPAPKSEAAAVNPVLQQQPSGQSTGQQARRRGWLLLIPGLLILLLLLSALTAGSYLYGSRAQERKALAQAEACLQAEGFSGVTVRFADGLLRFSGRVRSEEELARLVSALPPLPYGAAFEVQYDGQQLLSLQRALTVLGASTEVRAGAQGEAEIYGYIRDPYVEAQLLTALQPYFPALRFSPHFIYATELIPAVSAASAAAALPLSWQAQDFALVYNGDLTFGQLQDLKALQQQLSTELKLPLVFLSSKEAGSTLVARINDPKSVAALFQSKSGQQGVVLQPEPTAAEPAGTFSAEDVAGVTMQPLRFITLRNGQKYFEGAVLPGGAVLQQINLEWLVLNQHGQEVIYELR